VNIAVSFIRARSNLTLSSSSKKESLIYAEKWVREREESNIRRDR